MAVRASRCFDPNLFGLDPATLPCAVLAYARVVTWIACSWGLYTAGFVAWSHWSDVANAQRRDAALAWMLSNVVVAVLGGLHVALLLGSGWRALTWCKRASIFALFAGLAACAAFLGIEVLALWQRAGPA